MLCNDTNIDRKIERKKSRKEKKSFFMETTFIEEIRIWIIACYGSNY